MRVAWPTKAALESAADLASDGDSVAHRRPAGWAYPLAQAAPPAALVLIVLPIEGPLAAPLAGTLQPQARDAVGRILVTHEVGRLETAERKV